MRCPVDGTMLVPAERDRVEMSRCPQCHGAWLDRGEVDRLIKRAIRNDHSERGRRGHHNHKAGRHVGDYDRPQSRWSRMFSE